MDFFNLPAESIRNKEIPIAKLIEKMELKVGTPFPLFTQHIESCCIYSILNDKTFDLKCVKQNDSYYNEILFLFVQVTDTSKSEVIAKCLLRLLPYQIVIVLSNSDELCFATGLTREAKLITSNRKIDEFYISRWIKSNSTYLSELNISNMDLNSYKSLYNSFHSSVSSMGIDKEDYIPLTFVADLYAYCHGMDNLDLSEKIELNNKIKQMFPEGLFKSSTGKKKYRFSEKDVFNLLVDTRSYFGGYEGNDLIGLLWSFLEHEKEFELELPTKLRERVYEYGFIYWDDLIIESSDSDDIDHLFGEDIERHWEQTGIEVYEQKDSSYDWMIEILENGAIHEEADEN